MEDSVFQMMQVKKQEREMARLEADNDKTRLFGLSLNREEAKALVLCRNESLKKHRRVEFGEGILNKLIFEFCDSQYISQDNYLDTLSRMQDIFYEFKNESNDLLTDDELMNFMKEQFETICYGDLDYLEGTCMKVFTEAIRAGYRGYEKSQGFSEYSQFDTVQRWDKGLYYSILSELLQ